MDTNLNENQDLQKEEMTAPEKKSPFADSIYVTPFDGTSQPKKEKSPKKNKKKGGSVWLTIGVAVASCLITALIVDARWQNRMDLSNKVMSNRLDVLQEQIDWLERLNTERSQEAALQDQLTPGQVYAQNVSAVVAVSSQSTITNFYGQVTETASAGSGFIITENGYVVTNYHVIEGATSLTVLTYDGEIHEAQCVGHDEGNDIAVLKIEGEEFPCVTLGSSDKLAVGDQVVAIGNPLGELTSTLTVGYVSAKDRVVTTEGTAINMLQTDAAINAGNSGGPLFNMQGEVIGITTAKYTGTTESGTVIESIGFAIPMDDVKDMIYDLKEYGRISGAYLGVMVMDVSEQAQMYGLPAGAYVDGVESGLAADRAGIQKQDIIINLGGHSISSVSDLTRILRKFKPGDTTTVTVYRNGQTVNLNITLDEKPETEESQTPEQNVTDDYSNWFSDDFMEEFFGNLPEEFFDYFNW